MNEQLLLDLDDGVSAPRPSNAPNEKNNAVPNIPGLQYFADFLSHR